MSPPKKKIPKFLIDIGFSQHSILVDNEDRLPIQGYYFYLLKHTMVKKYDVLQVEYRKKGEFGKHPNPANIMRVYYVFPPKKHVVYQILADSSDVIHDLEFKTVGNKCSGGAPRIEDRKDGHVFKEQKLESEFTFLYSSEWSLHDMSTYVCSHDMTHVLTDDGDLQIGLRAKNFELDKIVDYTCMIYRNKDGLRGGIFYWYL